MIDAQLNSDYRQLAEQAGVAPLRGWTLLEFSGRDATSFLNSFCTNDVLQLPAGESREAFVCNVKGHVLGHIRVHRRAESLWIETVPGQAATLLAHWDKYLIREQVAMSDLTTSHTCHALLGPRADDIAHQLASAGFPGEILHSNFPRPGSRLLVTPAERVEETVQQFAALQVPFCDPQALEIVRLEEGYPFYGIDISLDNLPQEVDRDAQAIHFRKGCYLGQETVARIDALGHVNQLLRRVLLPAAAEPGSQLTGGNQPAGRVTSCAWSPRYQSWLALAYIKRAFATGGAPLDNAQLLVS